MTQLKNSLASSEWTLVLSLLAILISLVVLAKINTRQAAVLVEAQELVHAEVIPVTIDGAVAKPGTYLVKPGIALAQAMKKARPMSSANMRKIDLNQRISSPISIHVEELDEITVIIEGAVASRQELVLPLKTRICDLKSKLHFTEDADPELLKVILKKRRLLRDGEILSIPKKQVE